MDRDAIFVQVCAALFAANRTDKHPTELGEDVTRTLDDAEAMTDAILAKLTEPRA